MPKPAVFLDRDGVLVEEVGFITNPSQIHVPNVVPEALNRLRQWFMLIVVTNQSGIGRGLYTEHDLLEVHSALLKILEQNGARIDSIYYCPHHPQAVLPEYRKNCECRKPKPGMILSAARRWGVDLNRSFLIGDSDTDIAAAHTAGVSGIKVGQATHERFPEIPIVKSLHEAAGLIIELTKGHSNTDSEGVL